MKFWILFLLSLAANVAKAAPSAADLNGVSTSLSPVAIERFEVGKTLTIGNTIVLSFPEGHRGAPVRWRARKPGQDGTWPLMVDMPNPNPSGVWIVGRYHGPEGEGLLTPGMYSIERWWGDVKVGESSEFELVGSAPGPKIVVTAPAPINPEFDFERKLALWCPPAPPEHSKLGSSDILHLLLSKQIGVQDTLMRNLAKFYAGPPVLNNEANQLISSKYAEMEQGWKEIEELLDRTWDDPREIKNELFQFYLIERKNRKKLFDEYQKYCNQLGKGD